MRNSIRTRLTVAFIGLAIGPLLLVGAILAWQSFTAQTRQALDLQREVARRVGVEVSAFFEELENELLLVSKAQTLPDLDRDEEQSILKLLISRDVFDRLVLLDNQGQTQIHLSRLAHTATEANHYAETDAFIIPQSTGEIYYSPVRFEETTGEPLMTMSVPLFDIRTGLVDGVLLTEVRLKKIWNLIADIRVSPGQNVYIVDAQNKVVAHRNPSVVLRDTHFNLPEQDGIRPGLAGSNTVMAVDTVQVGQQEFNVVAEQTVSEALSLAINMIVITAIIIAAALIISVTLGFLIVRQIVQPIQMMATTAQTISAGDLSQQVPVTRQDELGVLAGAFNDMTGQLRTIINDLEQEIAERKQAEAALRQKTEELDQFFTVSIDLLCIADTDGYFRRLNPEWETLLGYSLPELEGQRFLNLVHPDDQADTLTAMSELGDQKAVLNFVNRYRPKDGDYRWIEWRARPVGNLIYAAARDITERRQAELELQERNRFIDTILEHAPIGFAVNTIDEGQVVFVSNKFSEIYGVPRNAVGTINDFFEAVYPDPVFRKQIRERITDDVASGNPARMRWENIPITTSTGQHRVITATNIPLFEQNLIISTVQDVTERARTEAALRESEFFLRKSQTVAQIGSYYFDVGTGKWICSPALDEMFGIDDSFSKDVEGWITLVHPDYQDEMSEYLSQYVLAERNRFDKEYRIIRYDNRQERWVHGLGELEFDEDGNAVKMIGTIQDITERKQAEEKIHQLNIELEQRVIERTAQLEAAQAGLLRQERLATLGKLTAIVSHEIRNPLATIRASTFAVGRKIRDKGLEVERALDRIERNITRCDNIIAELLDYTRTHDLKLRPVVFDNWLEQILDEQTLSEEITLSVHLATGIEVPIDPERFQRVIINLIDNACQAMLEFNEANDDYPPLVLSIQSEQVNHQFKISISDTGPGIPPDVMPHIFEPLYSTKGFGVGLGLPVVQDIVKQHQGEIEINSEVGVGTRVVVWLPLKSGH